MIEAFGILIPVECNFADIKHAARTSLPNLSEAVQILEDPKQMIPQEIHKKGRGTFKLKKVYTHYANKKSLRTKKRWRVVVEEMRYAVHDEWCACIITFFSLQ